ncbi:MAG: PhnD/SsuA/transferrin family substrate-binding protein [Gammaproteobacteria bacterium]|nr:PhnD/SsuA/transferrin family substrate-binding protein [Gammaproteobacteria bacterium]MDH5801730.1 PhnD/SsuA/transferrin family substrate-binding protein [Gammaproteobacteria bacterium]
MKSALKIGFWVLFVLLHVATAAVALETVAETAVVKSAVVKSAAVEATAVVLNRTPVTIGVLSYRGKDKALQRWQATADYLSHQLPGHSFQISALNLTEMAQAVATEQVDFVLTSPGNYVELESNYGISRIATMQSRLVNQTATRFGAVIIANADNTSVRRLEDLSGKSFMAVSPNAFGGFQMAWQVLKEHDIDPFSDFSRLEFVGFPQDQVALAVYDGRVDAATLRSETLVRMVESGWFEMDDFRILNPQTVEGHTLPLSTHLYPEWPFAKAKSTSRELATQVTLALLAMPMDHPAANASRTAGWTVPLDYSPVHELMKQLQIGPYEVLRETSLAAITRKYAHWLTVLALGVSLLVMFNVYVSRTNQRLRETDKNLRDEIQERKQSQRKLAEYKDTLEQRVVDRTGELELANQALRKSQIALHQLVDITSAPALSHEEKITQLLETGREYYQSAVASLSSLTNEDQVNCAAVGQEHLVREHCGPLHRECVPQVIEQKDTPLDIPDLSSPQCLNPGCGCESLRSYLATAIYVKGQPHCLLEFADTQVREAPYTHWDHNILQLMAQWIGSEMEKQEAVAQRQRHLSELARVARMSTMGEMAAGLAHELNQPLTGAINYSSGCLRRLKQGDYDEQTLIKGLERTVEGATLAADIIRQLREFVQKGDLDRMSINLNHVVLNIVDLVSAEIKRFQAKVSFDLCEDLPDVSANLVQLEQVVINFIRNGLDAMETTIASKRQLIISTECEPDKVRLSVRDYGAGLVSESDSRIFDAFYTTKPEGMGMGLSISRSIIEAHNGYISARNMEDTGAKFFFELPVH